MTRAIDRVVRTIRRLRLAGPAVVEAEVVAQLADLLEAEGHRVRREVRLDGAGRVDLLVDDGIAVEVKRGKPDAQAVRAQVARYARSARVRGIILVSERTLRGMVDGPVAGKPAAYVALSTQWGVA